jgi:polyisoprenoid-binding protein YceI
LGKRFYGPSGGLEAWRAAGLPLAGEAPDEPDDPRTFLQLEDRSYQVDTEQSFIEWTGRNPGTTHYGTVQIAGGKLTAKDGIVTGIFEIDMDSIRNVNLEGDPLQSVLIDHLKSDDFFLTRLFPRARFEIVRAEPMEEPFLTAPNVKVQGSLELRGIKADQNFTATFSSTREGGLLAEAHFDLDRTKWGVIYGSTRFYENLGMHMVFDMISIQVRITAN